eukprot:2971395-Rhodomonas_salina.1
MAARARAAGGVGALLCARDLAGELPAACVDGLEVTARTRRQAGTLVRARIKEPCALRLRAWRGEVTEGRLLARTILGMQTEAGSSDLVLELRTSHGPRRKPRQVRALAASLGPRLFSFLTPFLRRLYLTLAAASESTTAGTSSSAAVRVMISRRRLDSFPAGVTVAVLQGRRCARRVAGQRQLELLLSRRRAQA